MIKGWLSWTPTSGNDLIKALVESLGGILSALISTCSGCMWPIGVFGILVLIFLIPESRATILSLFRGAKSVSLWGAEFVLSNEARDESFEVVTRFRRQIKEKYDEVSQEINLQRSLDIVAQFLVEQYGSTKGSEDTKLRCTIHISDGLFVESLYQLLEYYPRTSEATRGRTKSMRFGIIGQAWRSGESVVDPEVSDNPAVLIRKWGMTQAEAGRAGAGRKSFAAVPLRGSDETVIGVFFMDAEPKQVFLKSGETPDEAAERIGLQVINLCRQAELIEGLIRIHSDVTQKGPNIEIFS